VRKLGPFRLGRVHGNDDVLELMRLGPLYEARNERTGAVVLVRSVWPVVAYGLAVGIATLVLFLGV
jgi:hypothetical protein